MARTTRATTHAAAAAGEAPDPARSKAPAVTRAAAILDMLAEHDSPVGPSELARNLGIAKSSALYICEALLHADLVRREGAGFQLGHKVLSLSAAYLAGIDIVSAFYHVCREHAPDIPETAQLSTLDRGLEVTYLAKREGVGPVRLASDIGRHLIATTTATGKAMLSRLDWPDVEARLRAAGPLPRLTPRSIADASGLRNELAAIREQGYAVDDEETLPGMFCIGRAVPTGDTRRHLYGISLTMLKAAATEERLQVCRRNLDVLAENLAARCGIEHPRPR